MGVAEPTDEVPLPSGCVPLADKCNEEHKGARTGLVVWCDCKVIRDIVITDTISNSGLTLHSTLHIPVILFSPNQWEVLLSLTDDSNGWSWCCDQCSTFCLVMWNPQTIQEVVATLPAATLCQNSQDYWQYWGKNEKPCLLKSIRTTCIQNVLQNGPVTITLRSSLILLGTRHLGRATQVHGLDLESSWRQNLWREGHWHLRYTI